MKVYYDKDADLELIKQKVAIVGYGSQGLRTNNLKDSGAKELRRFMKIRIHVLKLRKLILNASAEAASWADVLTSLHLTSSS